jgi:hypothetical protein
MHADSMDGHSEHEHTKQELREKAHQVAGKAQGVAESGKDRVVATAADVAQSLRRVSDELRSDDHEEVARYTQGVAAKIEQLADALRSRDLPSLAQDVKRLAQRQPALFLGGAFTAGLVAARFFRSSAASGEASRSSIPADASMAEDAQSPRTEDYGPAQGGYGPAASPAAAMGGNGNFGSESTGGDAAGNLEAASGSPFEREEE